MEVYRLADIRYVKDLSGTGAQKNGGRWNIKGTCMIYSSESRSLSALEYLVHVPIAYSPAHVSIAVIKIPSHIIPKTIPADALPHNWRTYPAPAKLAEIGTNWTISNETLLLRVPSAIEPHEFNILINPSHPDMKNVRVTSIEKYNFDSRLFSKSNP